MQEAAAAACANGTTLHASSAQTSSAASQSLSLPLSNGLLPQVAALPASEAIPAASLAAEQAAGAAAAGSLPNSLPMLASSGQLVSPAAAASLLLPPSQQQAVLAPCTAAGSMSRASNGYLMITNPYLPQPVTRSSSARLARGASEGTNTSAAMTASAAATPALPVAPPTQLGANGAMHIHPRHLAFQHFQQQQAALQQRQQQPVNAHGLASAHSLDSTDGDALDRMDRAASLASAQSDASRSVLNTS